MESPRFRLTEKHLARAIVYPRQTLGPDAQVIKRVDGELADDDGGRTSSLEAPGRGDQRRVFDADRGPQALQAAGEVVIFHQRDGAEAATFAIRRSPDEDT